LGYLGEVNLKITIPERTQKCQLVRKMVIVSTEEGDNVGNSTNYRMTVHECNVKDILDVRGGGI
jgi:hypothetical protein